MSLPFLGEIRLIASNGVPSGWTSCDGQTLSKDEPLFAWLGEKFGAGPDHFALPDLRGRIPMHIGSGHQHAQSGGQEGASLTAAQLPAHTHLLRARDSDGNQASPAGNVWARSEALGFSGETPDASMDSQALAPTGAGQSHENLMPFLGVRSMLALGGRTPDDPLEEDYFVGEIRMMAFEQVPPGWARCDGQLVSADDYPALFAFMGNTFGGSGGMFALPKLSGRVPIHRGPGHPINQPGGEESHALTPDELPAHSHQARAAATPGDNPSPDRRTWGVQSAGLGYAEGPPDVSLNAGAVSSIGGGGAHDNMPPFLTLQFCIALVGDFPDTQATATTPFAGEIRMFAYDFAPVGWAPCDGGILNVEENPALSMMLGSAYGGDGQMTFGLPDLRGRAPLHPGRGAGLAARSLGEVGGAETVSLTEAHLPAHTHEVRVQTGAGTAGAPTNQVFAAVPARALSAGYSSEAPSASMSPLAVTATDGGVAHNNMPPYLPINFCISLAGEVI
jgi:microcystin-dependent protein